MVCCINTFLGVKVVKCPTLSALFSNWARLPFAKVAPNQIKNVCVCNQIFKKKLHGNEDTKKLWSSILTELFFKFFIEITGLRKNFAFFKILSRFKVTQKGNEIVTRSSSPSPLITGWLLFDWHIFCALHSKLFPEWQIKYHVWDIFLKIKICRNTTENQISDQSAKISRLEIKKRFIMPKWWGIKLVYK